jgi:hypothetical protein
MQSRAVRGSLIVLGVLLSAAPASGGEESLGTVQLRGGYDANPTGLPGDPKGSAFITAGAAVAIGRDYVDGKVAFAGEGQHTEYALRDIAPSDRLKAALETEHDLDSGWTLRTSVRADNVTSYDTRALNIVGNVKLRPSDGVFLPFITGDLRYSTLNENNILYADFLPEPQKFVRATVIPGVAIVHSEKFEFGVSASISATRYADDGPLGLNRDNTRIQPFLFATYDGDDLDIAASVSRFDGRWSDPNFGNVRRTLYDVLLTKTFGGFKLDLRANRAVEDTTFPYVPVTLQTSAGIGLAYKVTPRFVLRTSAKTFRTDYLGVDLHSKTNAIGIGASFDFGDGWTVGLDAAWQRGTLIDGEPMTGSIVSLSLAKKFQLASLREKVSGVAAAHQAEAAPGWVWMPPPPHQPWP